MIRPPAARRARRSAPPRAAAASAREHLVADAALRRAWSAFSERPAPVPRVRLLLGAARAAVAIATALVRSARGRDPRDLRPGVLDDG